MGRIGSVVPLAEWTDKDYLHIHGKHPKAPDQHTWSFEATLDLLPESLDNNSFYCLPLFLGDNHSGAKSGVYVACLLVQHLASLDTTASEKDGIAWSRAKATRFSVPDAVFHFECTRVGVLTVYLSREEDLPSELKWIVDFEKAEPDTRNLSHITIY